MAGLGLGHHPLAKSGRTTIATTTNFEAQFLSLCRSMKHVGAGVINAFDLVSGAADT